MLRKPPNLTMIASTLSGGYVSLVILLDLVGNSFVLFATIAHSAIKLDKMCVWIIQNLAVVDIANAVMVLTPAAISFFTGNVWVLGSFICKLLFGYKYSFYMGNIFFINFLALNKLLRCLFPLRNLLSSFRQRLAVTITTLVIMLIGPLRKMYVVLVARTAEVRYSANHASCIGYQVVKGAEQHLHPKLERVLSFVFIIIPCVSLVVINTTLVILAVRSSNKKINRKNLLIVFLVTLIFVVTFLPFFIIQQIYILNFHKVSSIMNIALFVAFTSSFSNPMIYVATNETFRKFAVSKLWGVRGKVQKLLSSMQFTRSTSSSLNMARQLSSVKVGSENKRSIGSVRKGGKSMKRSVEVKSIKIFENVGEDLKLSSSDSLKTAKRNVSMNRKIVESQKIEGTGETVITKARYICKSDSESNIIVDTKIIVEEEEKEEKTTINS